MSAADGGKQTPPTPAALSEETREALYGAIERWLWRVEERQKGHATYFLRQLWTDDYGAPSKFSDDVVRSYLHKLCLTAGVSEVFRLIQSILGFGRSEDTFADYCNEALTKTGAAYEIVKPNDDEFEIRPTNTTSIGSEAEPDPQVPASDAATTTKVRAEPAPTPATSGITVLASAVTSMLASLTAHAEGLVTDPLADLDKRSPKELEDAIGEAESLIVQAESAKSPDPARIARLRQRLGVVRSVQLAFLKGQREAEVRLATGHQAELDALRAEVAALRASKEDPGVQTAKINAEAMIAVARIDRDSKIESAKLAHDREQDQKIAAIERARADNAEKELAALREADRQRQERLEREKEERAADTKQIENKEAELQRARTAEEAAERRAEQSDRKADRRQRRANVTTLVAAVVAALVGATAGWWLSKHSAPSPSGTTTLSQPSESAAPSAPVAPPSIAGATTK